MGETIVVAATAALLFAGTNVDDLFVLTSLFIAARVTGRPRREAVWIGQYLGMTALVAVSALAALGLAVIPDGWVGWLGLVPFAIGIRGLATVARASSTASDGVVPVTPPDRPPAVAGGALQVAALTVANGADNLAVYPPAFRTLGVGGSLVVAVVFAAGVAAWCAAGTWLGSHRAVIALGERVGGWLVPAVFVVVGLVVISTTAPVRAMTGR